MIDRQRDTLDLIAAHDKIWIELQQANTRALERYHEKLAKLKDRAAKADVIDSAGLFPWESNYGMYGYTWIHVI
jgi:hypothetical protein